MKMIEHNHFICHLCNFSVFPYILISQNMILLKKPITPFYFCL